MSCHWATFQLFDSKTLRLVTPNKKFPEGLKNPCMFKSHEQQNTPMFMFRWGVVLGWPSRKGILVAKVGSKRGPDATHPGEGFVCQSIPGPLTLQCHLWSVSLLKSQHPDLSPPTSHRLVSRAFLERMESITKIFKTSVAQDLAVDTIAQNHEAGQPGGDLFDLVPVWAARGLVFSQQTSEGRHYLCHPRAGQGRRQLVNSCGPAESFKRHMTGLFV